MQTARAELPVLIEEQQGIELKVLEARGRHVFFKVRPGRVAHEFVSLCPCRKFSAAALKRIQFYPFDRTDSSHQLNELSFLEPFRR